jgi:hypothetical protein
MITADITAFGVPPCRIAPAAITTPQARRALPAIILGLVGEVGDIAGQRLACPRAFERISADAPAKNAYGGVAAPFRQQLAEDEVVVSTRESKSATCRQRKWHAMSFRLAVNFTARRKQVALTRGKDAHPLRGNRAPLPRKYKKHTLPATPPDRVETWAEGESTFWRRFGKTCSCPLCYPALRPPPFTSTPSMIRPIPHRGCWRLRSCSKPHPQSHLP